MVCLKRTIEQKVQLLRGNPADGLSGKNESSGWCVRKACIYWMVCPLGMKLAVIMSARMNLVDGLSARIESIGWCILWE